MLLCLAVLMDESGFRGGLENYLSDCIVPSVKFGGEGIMVWGCLSGVGLGPLFPMKGTIIALAYQRILDNFMLPTLWEQFGVGDSCFDT